MATDFLDAQQVAALIAHWKGQRSQVFQFEQESIALDIVKAIAALPEPFKSCESDTCELSDEMNRIWEAAKACVDHGE